jgi:3-hydroxybutyryl-CoA dehydrogenase
MHFFNPVPLMRLVEVVSGLRTDASTAAAIFQLAKSWGKEPVHTRSTPGFIVNRIARPFYAETLALLHERAAAPEVLDACMRGAGFRMGPCELMDLIGHDTNFSVTSSVYAANFFDKRFAPSLVQRELVDGGMLGRKTGQGFYRYPGGAPGVPELRLDKPDQAAASLTVHGNDSAVEHFARVASIAPGLRDIPMARNPESGWAGFEIGSARLVLTDGRSASELETIMGTTDIAVFDRPIIVPAPTGSPIAFAVARGSSAAWPSRAAALLGALGITPLQVGDAPGLVVARTVAMIINEAADAVLQGVCTVEDADAAMKLGVNYPAGPFEWLTHWDASSVVDVLDALDSHYRGERYRVSPWLRCRSESSR